MGALCSVFEEAHVIHKEQECTHVPLITIPFFSNLTPKNIRTLEKLFKRSTSKKGDVISTSDSACNKFYLIISGALRLSGVSSTNSTVLISEFTTGQYFGEVNLMENDLKGFEIVAIDDCTYLSIDSDTFKIFLSENSGIIYFILINLFFNK